MIAALVLYVIVSSAVLVWFLARHRPSMSYVAISKVMLDSFMRRCNNLVVIELCGSAKSTIPGALSVPTGQLPGLLRWIPPKTTLVFCGTDEAALCSSEIESSLRGADINVVYFFKERRDSATIPATPQVAGDTSIF